MARLRGRNLPGRPRPLADELIDRFDIGDFRDRLVKNLSGGERRRVDLAAGLIDTPHVLVLDEPTTGLDPRSRQVVWSTIRQLVAEGVTLLLTTQYLEEADALADRVVLIDRGTEVAAGTPAQLKAQVGEQRVDIIAADSAAFDELCDAAVGALRGHARARAAHDLDPGAATRSPTSPASPASSMSPGSASTRWRCAGRRSTTRSWPSPATPPEEPTPEVQEAAA